MAKFSLKLQQLSLVNLHTDFWQSEIQNKVKKEKNPHREPTILLFQNKVKKKEILAESHHCLWVTSMILSWISGKHY